MLWPLELLQGANLAGTLTGILTDKQHMHHDAAMTVDLSDFANLLAYIQVSSINTQAWVSTKAGLVFEATFSVIVADSTVRFSQLCATQPKCQHLQAPTSSLITAHTKIFPSTHLHTRLATF